MTRRVVVIALLVAMVGAVVWLARFALSDGASTRDQADRPAPRDGPARRDPVVEKDPGVLPKQSPAQRAQLIRYVRTRGGRVAFVSVDAFLADPDGLRWFGSGDELPDGPVTALGAPDEGADAWLAGLADLPLFPILVARWTDLTDDGVADVAKLGGLVALRLAGAAVTDETEDLHGTRDLLPCAHPSCLGLVLQRVGGLDDHGRRNRRH